MKENDVTYTIQEVSRALDCDQQSLRRLCDAGLVPNLKRTLGRHRIFTADQVELLRLLIGLHNAGFNFESLRKYQSLSEQADAEALAERKAMLRTHKQQIRQGIEALEKAIDFLDRQEELLEQAEE